MKNVLIFSDKIELLRGFIKFHFTKTGRWFAILVKRKKRLEKISLDYYRNWLFENAYLVIDFHFKNAIWFKIGNVKGFGVRQSVILDLHKIKSKSINLEVFGFFQKQVYVINLNKETEINTKHFNTKIDNIRSVEIIEQNTRILIPKTSLFFKKPIFKNEKISVKMETIKIQHRKFNTQHYI